MVAPLLFLSLGIEPAPAAGKAYLNMPPDELTTPPLLLSETGAFDDTPSLKPAPSLISYDINLPFWSDNADKRRWISLPDNAPRPIQFHPTEPWRFPAGTVFVKHFEMPPNTGGGTPIPIETRLLVCDRHGGVYGATYRWRADGTDADLVDQTVVDQIIPGAPREPYTWYFPGRSDCRICHTPQSGGVLGVNTRQLNRPTNDIGHPSSKNQLIRWQELGLVDSAPALSPETVAKLPRLPAIDEETASLESRARAYLDVNCAMCHQPGGVTGTFDARFATALAAQNLVNGRVNINLGLDRARVIAPKDPWRSTALQRVNTLDKGITMPPLGHEHIDTTGAALLSRWIMRLPGDNVTAPPDLTPPPGEFSRDTAIKIHPPDPQAQIYYTLDGSMPTTGSALYHEPILTTQPVTLRAIAAMPGAKPSIAVKGTYIIRRDRQRN